jgi:DNA-binding transcriptional ArsR family regulator
MKTENKEDILVGTTLKVYIFVLKNSPVGIREVQRGLALSSPTLASYHLAKLEEVGLVDQTKEGYRVNQIFLKNTIRLGRTLIPRYFFYSIFLILALVLELTLFKPVIWTDKYVFAVGVTFTSTIFFIYETARAFFKGSI